MCALLESGEVIFFLNVDSSVEENEKVGGLWKAVWLIRVYWYTIKILIFSRENKRFYYRRKEGR